MYDQLTARGIDVGADAFKVARSYIPGDVASIPNWLLVGRTFSDLDGSRKGHERLHMFVEQSPFGIKGLFAFGKLAMENGGTAMDPTTSKLESPQIRYGVIAALAAEAATSGKVNFGIALGVPMLEWGRDEEGKARRLAWAASFKGEYRVGFIEETNSAWGSLGSITFHVHRVITVCEGAPAINATRANDEWMAGADLGGSTFDGPCFERITESGGIFYELRSRHCHSGPLALNDAMDRLTTAVQRTYSRPTITRPEVAAILVDRHGEMDNGKAQPLDILPLANQHLKPVAQQAAGHILSLWQKQPKLKAIELIGGGASILHPILGPFLDELWQMAHPGQAIPFDVRLAPNPRMVNAIGFYAVAQERFGNG